MRLKGNFPLYDIPVDYIMDDDITGELLDMYKMFPAKIKAGVFAVCTRGEVRVTLNLEEYTVKANDFITVIPGSFMQIHEVSKDTSIAFVGFSSSFINTIHFWKTITDKLAVLLNNPIVQMNPEHTEFFRESILLLTKAASSEKSLIDSEIMLHIVEIFYKTLETIYSKVENPTEKREPREYEILGKFIRLAFENYAHEHKATFYADEIGLTLSHFCATIKRATGKTVQDIIQELILNDAKAQLKTTDAKINKIAQSLGFSATGFNRYFLKYVKMTPLEYRNR